MPYIKSGKREVWINPNFENIIVGQEIVVGDGYHYYKAIVDQSLTRQINVTVTYPSGTTEKQVYSKTDGYRIPCNEQYSSDRIEIKHYPEQLLMNYNDVDKIEQRRNAEIDKRQKIEQLRNYHFNRLSAEQLAEIETLLNHFEQQYKS